MSDGDASARWFRSTMSLHLTEAGAKGSRDSLTRNVRRVATAGWYETTRFGPLWRVVKVWKPR